MRVLIIGLILCPALCVAIILAVANPSAALFFLLIVASMLVILLGLHWVAPQTCLVVRRADGCWLIREGSFVYTLPVVEQAAGRFFLGPRFASVSIGRALNCGHLPFSVRGTLIFMADPRSLTADQLAVFPLLDSGELEDLVQTLFEEAARNILATTATDLALAPGFWRIFRDEVTYYLQNTVVTPGLSISAFRLLDLQVAPEWQGPVTDAHRHNYLLSLYQRTGRAGGGQGGGTRGTPGAQSSGGSAEASSGPAAQDSNAQAPRNGRGSTRRQAP